MPTAPVGKAAPAVKPGVDGSAVKRLFQEDGYRQETKAAFEAHTRSNAGKDILERCKRLNEFLESDFLKGGGPQSKEQLKEILGMLNAGPKRPSFLDKPAVTATASKAQPPKQQAAETSVQPWGQKEAEQILSLLECQSDASTPRTSVAAAAPPSRRVAQQQDDVDDVIGLLNAAVPQPVRAGSGRAAKQAEQEAEKQRREQEAKRAAWEQEQARKVQAERLRKEEEARKVALAQEQAKQQQEQQKRLLVEEEKRKEAELQRQKAAAAAAAKLKQEEELKRRAREDEERRRKEEERRLLEEKQKRQAAEAAKRARLLAVKRSDAAVTIQSIVRMHLAVKRRRLLREQLHAAVLLQSCERARAARRLLHGLKVDAFRRRRAARCIAACYRAYKARWHLGPVRARNSSVPGAAALDGHAHLLALPLRLRSTADTRLAPESPGIGAGAGAGASASSMDEASASGKRTVMTARRRVGEMAKQEVTSRSDVGTRAVMAGSEHRDFQEAMQAVKASGAGAALGKVAARTSPGGLPLARASPRSLPTSRPGSNDSSSRLRP